MPVDVIPWLRTPIRVRPEETGHDPSMVSVTVDDGRLWFRSEDFALRYNPTAFASPFVIPAMHHRRRLEVDGALSPRWLDGVAQIGGVYRQWWGYRPVRVRGTVPPAADAAERGSRRAQCFTGGVDSFHSLLRGERPDALVFVRGFDMPLQDEARWSSFRDTLEEVGNTVGVRPVVIETNLRTHALFDSVDWERTHGSALAAIGHLLSGHIGALRIAATLTDRFQPPWGSHPKTDHLWSSEQMTIEHHGSEIWRHEKLWEIQDEPLVRGHLRVCWENRSPAGNCSRCDKCLITMLALAATDRLRHFPVFEPPSSFVEALDDLPKTTFLRTSELLAERNLDPGVAEALGRLRERTLALRNAS